MHLTSIQLKLLKHMSCFDSRQTAVNLICIRYCWWFFLYFFLVLALVYMNTMGIFQKSYHKWKCLHWDGFNVKKIYLSNSLSGKYTLVSYILVHRCTIERDIKWAIQRERETERQREKARRDMRKKKHALPIDTIQNADQWWKFTVVSKRARSSPNKCALVYFFIRYYRFFLYNIACVCICSEWLSSAFGIVIISSSCAILYLTLFEWDSYIRREMNSYNFCSLPLIQSRCVCVSNFNVFPIFGYHFESFLELDKIHRNREMKLHWKIQCEFVENMKFHNNDN